MSFKNSLTYFFTICVYVLLGKHEVNINIPHSLNDKHDNMATLRCSNCKKTINVDMFETNKKTQQPYKTCSPCRVKQLAKTGKQDDEIKGLKDTFTKHDERINELERDNHCLNAHIDHLEAVQHKMTSENKELLKQINELKKNVDELQKNQKIKLENDMFDKVVQESKQGLKKSSMKSIKT